VSLLAIRNLSVTFATRHGSFKVVDGVDLNVEPNEVVAIVGESGSGKSVAMLAVMGLLPHTATVTADRLTFEDYDLRRLSDRERRAIIGRDIAMIFQEPMSSLNPCFTAGFQIAEVLRTHLGMDRAARKRRVAELLAEVGITDPERRAHSFPHQLSGGMSQRVMIAMALACRPKLLIADEPTTALDVTVQKQILRLIRALQERHGTSVLFVSHDLGVVAQICDRVSVLYMGKVVEQGGTADILQNPRHPYTRALLAANPRYDRPDTGLEPTPPEVLAALRAEIAAFDAGGSVGEARDG